MSGAPAHGKIDAASRTATAIPRRIALRIGPFHPPAPNLPYEDGVEAFLIHSGLMPEWDAIENDFPGVTLRRMFFTLTPTEIANLQSPAVNFMPGAFEDLLRWFFVDTPPGADHDALLSRIQSVSIVAQAYLESPPTPPPAPPPSGVALLQGYLDAKPVGIGARAVWAAYANSRGEGMTFADVEQGWYMFSGGSAPPQVNHVDLLPPGGPAALPITMPAWAGDCARLQAHNHGTKVLGIIRANDNGQYVTGIASNSNGWCVCEYRPPFDAPSRGDAILTAAAHLSVGDVLLLEMQVEDSVNTPNQYYPAEIEPACRNAICVAVARGIVVIEATGNGQDTAPDKYGVTGPGKGDLDALFPGLRPGTRLAPDSGAVLVAGASRQDPHIRIPLTRYGSRVDCYAWGEAVETTDSPPPILGGCTGGPNATDWTEPAFGGSSSASAIIAGAALVVQSLHRAAYTFPAGARRVRDLLSDPNLGTNSQNGEAVDKIGVMPDLASIAARIVPRQLPEIYMRDHVGDNGAPHTGPISISPDIIVRQAPVVNPTLSFGPLSGHQDDDMLSDVVLAGQPHSLYVRLLNSALSDSGPVDVDVYWSESGTLVTPSTWRHIGADHTKPSIVVPNVPAGSILTVSDAIPWLANEVPGSGHFCFVALIGCAGDPAPHPLYLGDWEAFYAFIRTKNNVTWRNFDVINGMQLGPLLQPHGIPFVVAAAERKTLRMLFEATSDLPPDVRLEIVVPPELEVYLDPPTPGVHFTRGAIALDFGRSPSRTIQLGSGVLPAGGRWKCALRLAHSPASLPVRGEVFLRQVWLSEDGPVEVGRITWRFRV